MVRGSTIWGGQCGGSGIGDRRVEGVERREDIFGEHRWVCSVTFIGDFDILYGSRLWKLQLQGCALENGL